MSYVLFSIIIFLAEVVIKNYMEENDTLQTEKSICHGYIILTKYHNHGCFLNFMEKQKKPLKIITGVLVGITGVVFLCVLSRKGQRGMKFALSCLFGGAIGNFYDRFKRGYVVDYFSFSFLKRVVFNLSDLFILFGGLFIAIRLSLRKQ